jgi:hypothetical protein
MSEANALTFPARLSLEKISYLLDGGTALLYVADEDGNRHTILLVQHAFLEGNESNLVPGRLYFDRHLLVVRSETERRLLALLKEAAEDGATTETHLIDGVNGIIRFVESADYVELADKLRNH